MIFSHRVPTWGTSQIIFGDFSIWFGDLKGGVKNSEASGEENQQVWGRPGFYVGERMLVRWREK